MPSRARSSISASDADDVGDTPAFGYLSRRDVAEAEMSNQALALQLGQRRERRLDRTLGRAMHVEHDAQIDDVENIEAEIAQVVMHCCRKLLGGKSRVPRAIGTALGADLGDDGQIVGIGMQGLADKLVGDMRAIEIAGIDVVDAGGDRGAQHRQGCVPILRRPEDAGTGKLHGAIAEAFDATVAEGESA
jgi:hypothetical protein